MKTESQGPTVTFSSPNVYEFGEEHDEDDVYANAEMCTVDKTPATSDKKIPSIIQSFSPVAVCWGILLVIMALRIHFTSVLSAKLSDQMISSEEYDQCFSTNAILAEGYSNLQVQKDEMTQAHSVLERNITDLRGENQQLKEEILQVKAANLKVKEENLQIKEENQQMKAENLRLTAENENLKAENLRLTRGQYTTPWGLTTPPN